MKGLIFIYSGSGNTALACRYLTRQIHEIPFDFYNIATERKGFDFREYGVVGMATFTDFRGVPHLMGHFVDHLCPPEGMPAFVLTTHGFFSGKMPKCLADKATACGFDVIAGYSLHTPQNYPPLVSVGFANTDAPNFREMDEFRRFIFRLRDQLMAMKEGKAIEKDRIRMGWLNRLSPVRSREWARRSMGIGHKYVDEALCNGCGICREVCPYGALSFTTRPLFDSDRCYGCWACFNHCPMKAIHTRRIRGKGHYPRPSERLKKKLGA
jgi:ferredoxin